MNKFNGTKEERLELSNKNIQDNLKRVAKQIDESKEKKVEKEITSGQMNDENKNVNMGKDANAGLARDDSSTSTRLLDKHFSPLIVRKYQMEGWPLFIGIISDANLNDLDKIVYSITDEAKELGFLDGNIQDIRNYCGFLNDRIVKYLDNLKRGCAEGVMVCFYCDKMWTSAAFGDLMVHEKCVLEFYQIVNTLPHI